MLTLSFYLAFAVLILAVTGCANLNAEKRAPQLGQLINIDGTDMHVLTKGVRDSERSPVVLIHGASVNLRDMDIALGERLAKDRFVVMVDRPGRGYSQRPKNGYELDKQAALIRGVVQSLEVEKPVVVGQSFGGAVALSYALQFQDEMAGLVLLAPVSHEWPGGVDWHNHVSETPVAGFFFRRLVLPVYATFAAKGAVKSSFAPNDPPEDYYDRAGVPLLFRAGDFKSNASDIYHLEDQIRGQQDRYNELKLPVVIAAGENDRAVYPEIHSKQLEAEIDGARLTLIPETGHTLHHADPELMVRLIDDVTQPVEVVAASTVAD